MVKYKTVEDYIDALPRETASKVRTLRQLIVSTIPQVEEVMSYGIPCYNLVDKATLEEKLMIAGYKKHVSFYPHPSTIDAFREQLQDYTVRKGTIQFALSKPLPQELIQEMILYRYDIVKGD